MKRKANKQERLVAFLDVLGFSDLIYKNRDFAIKFKKYTQILSDIIERIDNKIEYVVFSDSIILITDNREKDFINFIQVLSEFSYKMLMDVALPIRGCVTSGEVSYFFQGVRRKKDFVIAGKPIIEAYDYEQKQNWIGIIISPAIIDSFPIVSKCDVEKTLLWSQSELKYLKQQNLQSFFASLQRYKNIPFKTHSNGFDGFAIVPHNITEDFGTICIDLELYYRRLDTLILTASDPDKQMKYKNTKEFIDKIKGDFWKLLRTKDFERYFPDDVKFMDAALKELEKIRLMDK